MNDQPGLSERGNARKAEIFEIVAAAQRRRAARRRAVRGGGALVVVTGAAIAAWWSVRPPRPTILVPAPIADRGVADEPGRPRIAVVGNDSTVLDRVTARVDVRAIEIIDDQSLEGWLARAGRPTGFIRTPGRFILASEIREPGSDGSG